MISVTQQPHGHHAPSDSGQNLGTLVWVGPTQQSQQSQSPWSAALSAAFRYCVEHAAQIAPRRSIDDLLNRPASAMNRVVIVKPSRLPAPSQLQQLHQLAPEAECWTLLSPQNEGESRTGTPWTGFKTLYWHRWNQVMPGWFAANVSSSNCAPQKKRLTIAVLSADRRTTGGLVDFLSAAGHCVIHAASIQQLQVSNLNLVLWDDSASPPASYTTWRARLQCVQPMLAKSGGFPRAARHIWCVGFPRPADVVAAKRGGIDEVFSKPYSPAAIGRTCLAGCLR